MGTSETPKKRILEILQRYKQQTGSLKKAYFKNISQIIENTDRTKAERIKQKIKSA